MLASYHFREVIEFLNFILNKWEELLLPSRDSRLMILATSLFNVELLGCRVIYRKVRMPFKGVTCCCRC
ncbi:MAG: hypothetical protein ACFFD4_12405 [Candidatus Odinarchaeota archaeon]